MTAINEMGAFSTPAEFSSTPAILGEEARQAQQPLLEAGRAMVTQSCALIATAKQLVVNTKEPQQWQQLATNSKAVSDSIKGLVGAMRDRAPGQMECDAAVVALSRAVSDIEQEHMSATLGTLQPRSESNLQGFQDQALEVLTALVDVVDAVHTGARTDSTQLAHAVQQLTNYISPLAVACIGLASKLSKPPAQVPVVL